MDDDIIEDAPTYDVDVTDGWDSAKDGVREATKSDNDVFRLDVDTDERIVDTELFPCAIGWCRASGYGLVHIEYGDRELVFMRVNDDD
jgi:hypothetical protein